VVTCATTGDEVLLVACDVPYPPPLHALRPLADTMAVALVLSPAAAPAGTPRAPRTPWMLRLQVLPAPAEATRCGSAALEALRNEIPAARALPLLVALAAEPGAGPAEVRLDAAEGCTLDATVEQLP
jgi:hypothetical protein